SDKISFSKDIDTFFKHKLEELDKDTNEFLSYFSAIGEEFPRKLFSLFSKDDKGLKKAIENGILTEEKGLIRFTHPVLQNILYQSIPLSKKRELHKEIGKVLEDSYPSRFEEILYHYLEAGNREGVRRIIPEVLKIENLRMLKLLLRSLPCIKDKNVKKDVLEKIANLYLLLGQYSKSFKFYEKTLELEENRPERASISCQLGLLSETMGQRMKALMFYEKGIDLLGDKKDILYVKIIGELGRVYCIMGKTKKALSYLQDALKISQLKKDIKIEALTLLKLGIVYYTQGNLKEAIKALRKVIEMDSEIKDNFMLSNAYVNLGYFYYQNREYNLAMEWYNKSLFIKKRIGDIKNIPILLINMGALLGERGEYSRALFLFKQGISLSKKNISLKTAFLANISYHFYLMGSYSETEKKLLRVLKIRKKTEEKLNLPLTFKNLSLIYLDQGIYKKAIESVNEGIEITRDLENKLLEIELLSV
ncbi:tetratricopeptide repeat protein, partial [candidate division WOR-3 bacterium]|nr:tetratricopeptide repeat protein [candidate division WOR-3 bacterium]